MSLANPDRYFDFSLLIKLNDAISNLGNDIHLSMTLDDPKKLRKNHTFFCLSAADNLNSSIWPGICMGHYDHLLFIFMMIMNEGMK